MMLAHSKFHAKGPERHIHISRLFETLCISVLRRCSTTLSSHDGAEFGEAGTVSERPDEPPGSRGAARTQSAEAA